MKGENGFEEFLSYLRRGKTLEELDSALLSLTKAVQETGKQGSITLTIKMKPSNNGAVEITDTLKCVTPEHDRGKDFFFVTPEYNLSRQQPKQIEMEFTTDNPDNVTPLHNNKKAKG